MPAKIKMRSVSVEDLGNIVKHMIDGVLEDNDQVDKLYQAVFEEYYFKNMEELKQVGSRIDDDDRDQGAKGSSTGIDDVPPKYSNSDQNFPNNCNLDQKSNSHDQKSRDIAEEKIPSADHSDSKIIITKSSNFNPVPNSREWDKVAAASSLHKEIGDSNFREEKSVDVVDAPIVHVVRRPRYTRPPQESDTQTAHSCSSKIALSSINNHTTTNLTRTREEVDVNSTVNIEEKVESEKNNVLSNNTEVIEWWNSSLKKEVPEQKDGQLEKPREIPIQFKNKGESAFENWKKEKTSTYRRVFKEEEKRLRLEQVAKAKQLAKKEAANEAYLHWRRQQDARQKLISNTKKRVSAQIKSQKLQSREKHVANSQAFKMWKKQKDAKLRERKMYMMSYDQHYYNPQRKPKPEKPRPGIHVAFNMWLDQLDCVLHQKYLRERRHLVHSFYCQPAYFGSAALCSG